MLYEVITIGFMLADSNATIVLTQKRYTDMVIEGISIIDIDDVV